MKDILVLTRRVEDFSRISSVLPESVKAVHTTDLDTALALHTRSPFDLILADITLLNQSGEPEFQGPESKEPEAQKHLFTQPNPFVQMAVLCDHEHVVQAQKAVKAGAAGYLLLPVQKRDIQLLLASISRALSRDFELDYLRDHFWKTEWMEVIQSKNPGMKKIYENVRSAAPTIATVLLLGETGTGKGMMARLIHWHSQRYEKPFISVHCGAIPDTLLESELFGHEKGAFTGANRRKPGKFEMAEGGTIFLDEIGTISPQAQIKLLQVLQDNTFNRIGDTTLLTSDVRIIAATNSDLAQQVKNGSFRKDLYYRLNVFPIYIPALRERLEDLDHLITIFLKNLNEKYGKNIQKMHPSVIGGFRQYEWPGNIRELENIIERAYILEQTHIIMPQNLPMETMLNFDPGISEEDRLPPLSEARQHAVRAFEFSYLSSLLEQTQGRIDKAAQMAGVTTRQLSRLLTRHSLDKKNFKQK